MHVFVLHGRQHLEPRAGRHDARGAGRVRARGELEAREHVRVLRVRGPRGGAALRAAAARAAAGRQAPAGAHRRQDAGARRLLQESVTVVCFIVN